MQIVDVVKVQPRKQIINERQSRLQPIDRVAFGEPHNYLTIAAAVAVAYRRFFRINSAVIR